jgi:hypothetical protein
VVLVPYVQFGTRGKRVENKIPLRPCQRLLQRKLVHGRRTRLYRTLLYEIKMCL